MLVVPWVVPYHSIPQNSFHGCTLFDVDLARVHGLEVMVSADEEGHLIAYCEGKEYHCGCICLYSLKNKVKVVSVPLPDEIAWFALASIDPPLVDHTLTRFSAQWWQDGDTGRIFSGEFTGKLARIVATDSQYESVTVCVSTPQSSDAVVKDLEISIHDFKLEFHPSASVKVIAGMNCGFEGMLEVPGIFLASHVSPTVYTSRDPHKQLLPHKGLSGTLHHYSGHEILVTLSTLPQKGTDNPSDKGKSKADESETTGGDNDINEDSNLVQVPVSMDDAIILPLPTLQFSKERGYDVSIGDCVQVVHGPAVSAEGLVHAVNFVSGCLTMLSDDGPWHNVPIGFCMKLENYSLCDVERQRNAELKNTAVITKCHLRHYFSVAIVIF
ncbi:hypothetical protein EDD17DRAFT_1764260 [Pisolithus thermaeus]|nr:hypothetical protein EV401DRAFT_2080261 [Pisolithus croceorrhizus]KAI6156432.1 hypothetical protein EDD17DRAFT_1764260 [Pisolithus thermaeus]